MLIRSKLSIKLQNFVQVVLEKAKKSCNQVEKASKFGFLSSAWCFSLHSIGFCLPPNGILVLIRSKLSMKFQSVVQVVLEKAIKSYRGYKGHAKVVLLSPSDCFSFYLESPWLPPSDVLLGFNLSPGNLAQLSNCQLHYGGVRGR